jgi:hypothetical protein
MGGDQVSLKPPAAACGTAAELPDRGHLDRHAGAVRRAVMRPGRTWLTLTAAWRSTRAGSLAAQAPSGRANLLLEGPPGDRDAELQHQPDAPGVGQHLRLR